MEKGCGPNLGVERGRVITGSKNHDHLVLTVGDRPGQACDLGPVLSGMTLNFTHVKTGQQGINAIDKGGSPLALIICDQRLKDMKGTALLARIKQISPETTRLLITGYSDMDTIISAVNKGAVHRYISVPWSDDQLIKAVGSGLARYDNHRENDRLFTLAKIQNKKLFELNCSLMETTKQHDRESLALEKKIAAIAAKLKRITADRPLNPEKLVSLILKKITHSKTDQATHLNTLYEQTIFEIHKAVTDLALRNGLEMSESKQVESRSGEVDG